MPKYILNAENMHTREDAHNEIARVLNLPAHYGRNLDALWDVLSCLEGEFQLENPSALSGYGEKMLSLLREAAEKNSRIILSIQS